MKTKSTRSLALAVMFPFIRGILPVCAQLPMLEQPWTGYFAVAENSEFRFFISQNGAFEINVLTKDGVQTGPPVTLQFLAVETLPDGSVRQLTMKLDSIESADTPTAKLKKTSFRCKLTDQPTGQPTLGGTIEIANRTILANVRIMDKGTFDKNPLRPVIRANFPQFYASEQNTKAEWDKRQIREFEKQIGEDQITLKHLDGNRIKLECVGATDAQNKDVNGVGSSSVEVEISAFQKRKIEFLAATNSTLTIGNASPAPLHNGFWLEWSADAAKDPNNNAKLSIRVK